MSLEPLSIEPLKLTPNADLTESHTFQTVESNGEVSNWVYRFRKVYVLKITAEQRYNSRDRMETCGESWEKRKYFATYQLATKALKAGEIATKFMETCKSRVSDRSWVIIKQQDIETIPLPYDLEDGKFITVIRVDKHDVRPYSFEQWYTNWTRAREIEAKSKELTEANSKVASELSEIGNKY